VEVMHRPADEFVASFVGMENVLTGKVIAQSGGLLTITVAGRPFAVAGVATPGEEALFCIRPEHVTVTTADPGGTTSARNVFSGVIGRIIPMGAYFKLHLECGFPLVAYLTAQSLSTLLLAEGGEVFVSFKATAVHLIRAGN
jgi:tungstate transport system ATP-binding protein